ncbi:Kinetochore protein spc25 [Ceratobasidium theobromae]|uniref:Kinetochore protein spc25 n=1 Tax=Ceratobasidium theobromae TaxID=1582974 RepID=A0A5N5QIK9_9AGAM|nr:Kinetochore protein spc25 [Ceratobasidium theobromae]
MASAGAGAGARQPTRPELVTDLRKLLAQASPSIPLYFDPTAEKMSVFTNAVTGYVGNGQGEILRRQDKHKTVIRREHDKIGKMNGEIEQFRVDEMNLMKTLKKEQEEKAEAEAKLAEFDARLKDVEETRAAVDVELEGLRSRTEKLRLEKSQDLAKLQRQVALNEPEARALGELLKWSVEGMEGDVLRIGFTHIDESDWAREFSFVLDVGGEAYKDADGGSEDVVAVAAADVGAGVVAECNGGVLLVCEKATAVSIVFGRSGLTDAVAASLATMESTLPKATRKATSPAQPLQQPFPQTPVYPNQYYYPYQQPYQYYPEQQQFAQWAFQQMMLNQQMGQRTPSSEYGYPVPMGFQASGTPPPHPHPQASGHAVYGSMRDQGFHPYRRPPQGYAQGYPQPPRPYAREMNGSATSLHSTSSRRAHTRTHSAAETDMSHPASPTAHSASPTAHSASSTAHSASPTARPRPSPLSQAPDTRRLSRDDSTLDAPHAALPRTSGLKGRLRRALSFSAISTLDDQDDKEKLGSRRKAIEKANKANAALQKDAQLESPGPPESIRTTASKKPKTGLFNRRLNASTDNISLQSTVSSASVMIRKLGSMGKLARRNSLAGLTGLFKDKHKPQHKADASEASVTHATVEVDRLPTPDDMTGLSPAAKLARQHTLKSNAQAAERARIEAQQAAQAAQAQMAQLEEEDEDQASDDGTYEHGSQLPSGFDDEDITVRMERTHLDDDEVWAVGIRRSLERTRMPLKGILRNAIDFDQERYLDKENAPSLRQRANSYTTPTSQPGPLARIPSPDPDHIDGLHRSSSPHDTVRSAFSADFGDFTTPSLSLSENNKVSSDKSSFNYTHPALNSSAPVLSSIGNTMVTQRSATVPGRVRRLTFATNLSVYDTFAPSTYDRRSEPATCNRLTPALAQRIKEELNSYKMEEMEVHASSRIQRTSTSVLSVFVLLLPASDLFVSICTRISIITDLPSPILRVSFIQPYIQTIHL